MLSSAFDLPSSCCVGVHLFLGHLQDYFTGEEAQITFEGVPAALLRIRQLAQKPNMYHYQLKVGEDLKVSFIGEAPEPVNHNNDGSYSGRNPMYAPKVNDYLANHK